MKARVGFHPGTPRGFTGAARLVTLLIGVLGCSSSSASGDDDGLAAGRGENDDDANGDDVRADDADSNHADSDHADSDDDGAGDDDGSTNDGEEPFDGDTITNDDAEPGDDDTAVDDDDGAGDDPPRADDDGATDDDVATPNGPSNCPVACDDGDACTTDIEHAGAPGECPVYCSSEPITECIAADGCCPSGCEPTTDSDCAQTPTTSAAIPDDRRVAWAPGIEGGIPERTEICATVDAALGDGATEASSAIQDALDACPQGQVVELPAGVYRTTAALSLRSGVVLRGAGPTHTRIELDDASVVTAIEAGGQGPNNAPGVVVTAGLDKGSTELTLSDASTFDAGDIVLLDQIDDPDLIETGDCSFFKRNVGGYRSLGQIFEVTGKNGNTVTVSSPLHFDYSAQFEPELSHTNEFNTVRNAGVENLHVTRTGDYGGQGSLISLASAAYSWVRNVETERVSGRHIRLETAYRCVVSDSFIHDAWQLLPGGTAYGIAIERHASDNLVENNVVTDLNIPIVLGVSGGGNVISYNYVEDAVQLDVPGWNTAGIRGHCSFPFMELVEGNQANQAGMDNVHGGAGYLTFYRNHLSGQRASYPSEGNHAAISLARNQLYMNVVGNVLWTPGVAGELEACSGGSAVFHLGGSDGGCDDRVAATLLRHGNFDFVTGAVQWDEQVADRALPPSLYLTTRPAFFGDLTWPPFDPEAAEPVGELPAKMRYDQILSQR